MMKYITKTILLLSFLVSTNVLLAQNRNSITMEQRLTFITLGVEDLNASVDFYENKLGWKRSEMGNENLIVFDLKGIRLALFSREELAKDATVDSNCRGFRGFTLSYNVWSEKDVDNLMNRLKARGVKVIKEPQKVFWGGYSSYIADPDGNLCEIAYNPYLKKD